MCRRISSFGDILEKCLIHLEIERVGGFTLNFWLTLPHKSITFRLGANPVGQDLVKSPSKSRVADTSHEVLNSDTGGSIMIEKYSNLYIWNEEHALSITSTLEFSFTDYKSWGESKGH